MHLPILHNPHLGLLCRAAGRGQGGSRVGRSEAGSVSCVGTGTAQRRDAARVERAGMQAGAVWLKTMRELWHEQARRNHTSTAHQHSSKAQHQQYRNLQQSAGQQYSAAAKRTVVADARQQAGVVADDDHAALKLLQSVGQRVDGLQSGGREGRHGGAGRQAGRQKGKQAGI